MPNVFPPLLVQVTLAMGYVVLLEAGLSFLGLGIQPPFPSLGNMLAESQQYLYQAWWYPFFPGAAISVLLLGLNWVAEALYPRPLILVGPLWAGVHDWDIGMHPND